MIDKEALRSLLERKGATQADVARELGLSEAAISDMFNGKRQLKAGELADLATFLNASVTLLLSIFGFSLPHSMSMLTISGHIKGDEVIMSSSENLEEETVIPVTGYAGKVLRVTDNTNAPRFQAGDLVAYLPTPINPLDLIGRAAIIEMEDGRFLLKVLHAGSEPDRYLLVSHNPVVVPLANVRIKAVYKIDLITP